MLFETARNHRPIDGSASTPLRQDAKALDALPQTCGLSLPTLNQQGIGIMSHRKHLDLATGNCGVSLPTLLTRIDSMAAHGLDNRIRMGLAKPPRRPTEGPAVRRAYRGCRLFRREPMTARAGPVD
jgi:hypothetical protein